MTALEILSRMAYESARVQHPNIPVFAIPKPKFKDVTSNGLTKCMICWIRLNGGQAERTSVEGRVLDGRKTFHRT
ncbi:hypothetical protein QE357_001988 [Siphonobacter sp. BAB-5404]|nr:hypothetical protein [Siphonobacter sp. SORGH_AS_0500]